MDPAPYRQIRALYDDTTIAVYQAYPPEIADPALVAGTFVPPFSLTRMTWIKPSFLWTRQSKPGAQPSPRLPSASNGTRSRLST